MIFPHLLITRKLSYKLVDYCYHLKNSTAPLYYTQRVGPKMGILNARLCAHFEVLFSFLKYTSSKSWNLVSFWLLRCSQKIQTNWTWRGILLTFGRVFSKTKCKADLTTKTTRVPWPMTQWILGIPHYSTATTCMETWLTDTGFDIAIVTSCCKSNSTMSSYNTVLNVHLL